jgi:hypothetical protein
VLTSLQNSETKVGQIYVDCYRNNDTNTEYHFKNEWEELSCILLGYEQAGVLKYIATANCNRKDRNSIVRLKEIKRV